MTSSSKEKTVTEIIGSFLLNANPWWFGVLGLLLIIIDLAIASTEVLLFLGFAAFLLIGPRLLTENPNVMAWSVPAVLFISYAASEKFLNLLFRTSEKANAGSDVIGKDGVVVVIENRNLSTDSFYAYRESISHESKVDHIPDTTLRVKLENGQTIPLKNPEGLRSNDSVQVTDFDGANATVQRK